LNVEDGLVMILPY